jgi:hypothetical protein
MGMGVITLLYYSVRHKSNILNTCGRIFIASSIFFGLLIINIIIPYIYNIYKKRKIVSIQIKNDHQMIHYQKAPHDYFSIDDDEEEIIIDKTRNKKTNDTVSIQSGESYLITNF